MLISEDRANRPRGLRTLYLKGESGPAVVGISGPICAGKTTASRFLERDGFAYTRFSLIVDDEIRKLGLTPDRQMRQRIGLQVNRTKGQRWLCEQALARVGAERLIVVDGLRFLDDRAFFLERYGARFLHVHIVAPADLRKKRYQEGDGGSFEEADAMPVEGEVDRLGGKADDSVDNSFTMDSLDNAITSIVRSFIQKANEKCQSRSS